jgi:hypothetical protein
MDHLGSCSPRFDAFMAASLGILVLWFLSEMISRKQKTLYQASSMFDEVNQGGNSSNEKRDVSRTDSRCNYFNMRM